MKICILGGGLLGVSTAYVLASRGHEVEVIERNAKAGAETSFANGGQLSYSHAEPWANLHTLKKLPVWLFHKDSPLIFRPRADLDMLRWGLLFLRECLPGRAEANAINILRLGLYSRVKTLELLEATKINVDYGGKGILHLFGGQKELDHAKYYMDMQTRFGCEQNVLTRDETLALEPTLMHTSRPIIGSIHSTMDASADANMYCVNLAQYCAEKMGVKFHYNTSFSSIDTDRGVITGVKSQIGLHKADAYVLATGSYSLQHMKALGLRIPVYPMKGYSLTVQANSFTPEHSLTDGYYKVVYSRLGNRLRVAGTAEFAGYDTRVLDERINPILNAARGLLPGVNWDNASTWACLRPSTPTGTPLLGTRPEFRNLYLNTGHGTLGWTQAAGSAHIVADMMENKTPAIDLAGLKANGS